MRTVRTEAELQNAILAQEADIQVAADFNITEEHSISHTVTISSAQGEPYTLSKAAGYNGYLFTTLEGGSLTLRDIILDGARETHAQEEYGGELIVIRYGTLVLDSGSVLQNNNGGGVDARDSSIGTPITLIIRGNATIRGNRSDFGGVVDFFASLPESSLQISGQALFEKNEGGGLRYFGQSQNTLTIGDQVKFLENSGMGIEVYYSGLHLMGNVDVSGNQASGIYFIGTRLEVDAGVTIRDNHVGPESNGGGINLSGGPEFAIHGLISGNTAGQGGGIYYEAGIGGTIDLSRARFVNNKALNQDYGRGGGFAIYERGSSGMRAITLDDAVFEGNQSVLDGGGMSIEFLGQYGGPGTASDSKTTWPSGTGWGNGTHWAGGPASSLPE